MWRVLEVPGPQARRPAVAGPSLHPVPAFSLGLHEGLGITSLVPASTLLLCTAQEKRQEEADSALRWLSAGHRGLGTSLLSVSLCKSKINTLFWFVQYQLLESLLSHVSVSGISLFSWPLVFFPRTSVTLKVRPHSSYKLLASLEGRPAGLSIPEAGQLHIK